MADNKHPALAGSQPYTVLGGRIRDIPVGISYRIIDLFSANMYKSPNKAIEELVSNSRDAEAQHVWLSMSANLRSPEASIWVVDDGTSMDLDELLGSLGAPEGAGRGGPCYQPA